MGNVGRPALLRPVSTKVSVVPNMSWSLRIKPVRFWCSNFVAIAVSIWLHGSRVASTAKGSLKLIMASIRLRKKSKGCIIKSLRNQLSIKRFLGDLVHMIYTKKLVFMRVSAVLQGRLFIEHEVWPSAIGAISAAYRNGSHFNVSPPMWSIVFGWRIPVKIGECQIRFTSRDGAPVIALNNYLDSGKFKVEPILGFKDFDFTAFGIAQVDGAQSRVQSDSYTDAGMVSKYIVLPPGTYRIEAIFDWDVTAEDVFKNGGDL